MGNLGASEEQGRDIGRLGGVGEKESIGHGFSLDDSEDFDLSRYIRN